jgi:bis(5'-nucleosyl)-tetraphosphatase (symmetrical)
MSSIIKSCFAGISRLFHLTEKSDTGSPLPRAPHVSLSAGLKQRLVIVSDIHGCLDELERLLLKVKYSPETTTVVCVGDTIAKGPKSVQVLRFLRKEGIFSVRGNHEDNLLLAHCDPSSKYRERPDYGFRAELTQEELDYIQEWPVSITIPQLSLLIVHAGLDPTKKGHPVHIHNFSELIRIRCIDAENKPTKKHPDGVNTKLWASLYTGPPFVVFGHDAKSKLQVHPWARGLDTGCVYGGSLTALVINDTSDSHNWMRDAEIVSVPAARAYTEKEDD